MPDAMLAGLPRLVRVGEELRWRGQTAATIGAAMVAYWTTAWLLDQSLRPLETLISALVVAILTGLTAGLASGRRVPEALEETKPPPRLSVYETHADGRERRARAAGIVLLGVVVLLVFDRVTDGGGVMAGLLAGFFGASGIVDWREARRWVAAERERDARLYLLIRANALVARFGRTEIYEVRRSDRERDRDPLELGLGL
jgi:hypothetical protein